MPSYAARDQTIFAGAELASYSDRHRIRAAHEETALYKQAEIGKPISASQYAAMAEVLRYVYQLKGKKLPAMKDAA